MSNCSCLPHTSAEKTYVETTVARFNPGGILGTLALKPNGKRTSVTMTNAKLQVAGSFFSVYLCVARGAAMLPIAAASQECRTVVCTLETHGPLIQEALYLIIDNDETETIVTDQYIVTRG